MNRRHWTRSALLMLLALAMLVMSGCWSRKELNDLAVIVALGIDQHKDGYKVSAQVLNPNEVRILGGSRGGSPVVTYRSVGTTVPGALQRLLAQAPRLLYLAHVRVVVLGEALARKGLTDTLDFIARSPQLRTDFFLLVARDSEAEEILDVATPFEHVPASSLYSSILISHQKWAATGKVTLQDFIVELERGGSAPVLSGVEVIGDPAKGNSLNNVRDIRPSTMLQHAGLAVFRDDRLVGWLGESSSKTTNYVLNEVDETNTFVDCPDEGIIGLSITQSKSEIKARLTDNGMPAFTVLLHLEADLNTAQCSVDLTDPAMIRTIEDNAVAKYNERMERNIHNVQERFAADIYGFGEALHRQHPKIWKKYRSEWNDMFKTVHVDVDTKLKVKRVGSIIQPLRRELIEK